MAADNTPWADDEVQTTDPEQHFANSTHDGLRGLRDTQSPDPGCVNEPPHADGAAYREFMHVVDETRFATYGTLQTDAIFDVRGTRYLTGTSFLEMYGMSGSANDYAYSRHLADPARAKVDGYIYEFEHIGEPAFQPPFEDPPGPTDMIHVIRDVAAGLTALLLGTDRIPIVECTPTALDFGRVRVGTSRQRNITLTNRGVRAFTVAETAILGTAGPFTVGPASQMNLDPGESATIPVTASPAAVESSSSRATVTFAFPNEDVRDVRIVGCTVSGCTVSANACVAPTFRAASGIVCLWRLIIYGAMIIALAIFAWIPSVMCTIKQLLFRIRNCGTGNSDACRTL
jgi:hypothetical protein